MILENKVLMNLNGKSFLFFYEIMEKTYQSKDQEIKASTIRTIAFLLSQVDSIEQMQSFWSVFE